MRRVNRSHVGAHRTQQLGGKALSLDIGELDLVRIGRKAPQHEARFQA